MFGFLVGCRSVCSLHTTRFVYREAHVEVARVSLVEEKVRFASGRIIHSGRTSFLLDNLCLAGKDMLDEHSYHSRLHVGASG